MNSGRAFACGVARGMSASAFIILTVIVVYVAYIVWSCCEELTSGGLADVIGDLLGSLEKDRFKHTYYQGPGGLGGDKTDYAAVERSIMIRSNAPTGKLSHLATYLA